MAGISKDKTGRGLADAGKRREAIFGAFDGTTSMIGLVFGLAVHDYAAAAIVIAGVSAATSATVSMGAGEYESSDGAVRRRLQLAGAMALATAIGSVVPVVPFFLLRTDPACAFGGAIALAVGLWIGHQKRVGWRGYASAVATLFVAAAVSVGVAAAIPASAGG